MNSLTAALEYYDQGWLPMPLLPSSKLPALERWRHYQYPSQRPTRDEILDWFTARPDANVAILTGRASGLVVVDFDLQGVDTAPTPMDWPAWCRTHDLPIPERAVLTGGGGLHGYYLHPGLEVSNAVRLLKVEGVGVDIRADGGYVVAPPSRHENGQRYVWLGPPTLPTETIPDVYLTLLKDKPHASGVAVEGNVINFELERLLRGVGQGERNHAAARLAGYWLRVTQHNLAASWAALSLWNQRNKPPLPEHELRRTLLSIAERDESGVTPVSTLPLLTGAAWAEDVRDVPPRSGIPAPALPTIDEMGGLVEGDLVILAGRPGMGKSTVAWNVAVDVGIKQNVPTLLFSTEMTRGDVARWIGTCLHRVPPRALSQSQWQQTLQSISRSAITICDKGLVSSTDVMQAVKDQQPRVVIIDHLQRLLHKRGGENRNRELEEIASLCKGLSKDYHCTFIVLSQLNRMSAREARRPEQFDLRDSGGIEQEADGIIFLWTPELDLTHALLPMRFSLAKNRHGMIREQSVIFDKELKRFVADFGIANAYAAVRHTETLNDDD